MSHQKIRPFSYALNMQNAKSTDWTESLILKKEWFVPPSSSSFCSLFIFREGKKCMHFAGSWQKRLEKWFIHIQLVWREFCGYSFYFFFIFTSTLFFVACIVVVGRQIVYFLSSYHCFARTNRSVLFLLFCSNVINVDGCDCDMKIYLW